MTECKPRTMPCTAQCSERRCGYELDPIQERNREISRRLALDLVLKQQRADIQSCTEQWSREHVEKP